MNITDTIVPNSAQINAEDLLSAPVTVTITEVERGSTEQPVFIHVAEFPGRTYRPGKSMRRVLVAAWGAEASAYKGRRLTLFNDPTIRFGKDVTGGIRISHMSHLEKPLTVALTVTRGRRAPFTVQPLPDAPTADPGKVTAAVEAITTATDETRLNTILEHATRLNIHEHPDIMAAVEQWRTNHAR